MPPFIHSSASTSSVFFLGMHDFSDTFIQKGFLHASLNLNSWKRRNFRQILADKVNNEKVWKLLSR